MPAFSAPAGQCLQKHKPSMFSSKGVRLHEREFMVVAVCIGCEAWRLDRDTARLVSQRPGARDRGMDVGWAYKCRRSPTVSLISQVPLFTIIHERCVNCALMGFHSRKRLEVRNDTTHESVEKRDRKCRVAVSRTVEHSFGDQAIACRAMAETG